MIRKAGEPQLFYARAAVVATSRRDAQRMINELMVTMVNTLESDTFSYGLYDAKGNLLNTVTKGEADQVGYPPKKIEVVE